MEATETKTLELPYSLEKPRNVAMVVLPNTLANREGIKLGMHTDSILTLLRTLSQLPDINQIKVEGRVLTEQQRKLLEDNTFYKFFIQSRFVRSPSDQQLRLAVPTETGSIDIKELMSTLSKTPFTPSSLKEEIGHKSGFYNASALVSDWTSRGLPNDFLPLFGGVNQFLIGSDRLSPARLKEIKHTLEMAFFSQEAERLVLTSDEKTLREIARILNLKKS